MWFTLLSIVYVLVCAFLILVVLLQQGKGGGMGSAFGGSTQTVFGGAGAGNFLTRLTAIAATLFMVLSALLAYMSSSGDRAYRAAEEVEASQRDTTIGGEGEGETEPASRDTLEDAQDDEILDALEEAARQQAGEQGEIEAVESETDGDTAAEEPGEPAADEPAAEQPAAEAPAQPAPEPESVIEEAAPGAATRPARPVRPARPRPAQGEGEAAPAPAPAPAAED